MVVFLLIFGVVKCGSPVSLLGVTYAPVKSPASNAQRPNPVVPFRPVLVPMSVLIAEGKNPDEFICVSHADSIEVRLREKVWRQFAKQCLKNHDHYEKLNAPPKKKEEKKNNG